MLSGNSAATGNINEYRNRIVCVYVYNWQVLYIANKSFSYKSKKCTNEMQNVRNDLPTYLKYGKN